MIFPKLTAISLFGTIFVGALKAIVFGFAFKKIAHQPTNDVLTTCAHAVSMAVRWVIQLAPFGIMGLVFEAVADNGISIFYDYGKLLCLLVASMLFVALVVNPLISTLYMKKNAYPLLFRCLKDSGVMAFFTRSSAANIPVNMALCERLGLERDFYSVSIPLGATINMNGAAGFILGVVQDSCETALNSSGDVFFAATAEYRDLKKSAK